MLEDSVPNSEDAVDHLLISRVHFCSSVKSALLVYAKTSESMIISPLLHFVDCKLSSLGRNGVEWFALMAFIKSSDGGPDRRGLSADVGGNKLLRSGVQCSRSPIWCCSVL